MGGWHTGQARWIKHQSAQESCGLESAPVPVAGHADRHLGLALARGARAAVRRARRHGAARDRPAVQGGGRLLLLLPLLPLLPQPPQGAAGEQAAVAAAPDLEVAVAVLARPAELAARVVVGALVEGDLEVGVRVAEDVAAAPAVVAAHEVVEEPLAGRVVAYVGLEVGLCDDLR